jgi:predicted amidophosphoribosyltransferase
MLADLVLPLECGGCGAPSTRWCDACAQTIASRADEPVLVTPRLDPGVPVFALGRYAGPRRQAILAVKERGRADLVGPLGDALRTGLSRLLTWGVLAAPLVVVPAPTRFTAARRRGGDPVARMARAAAVPGVTVVDALRMRALTKDSVGLSAAARQRNVTGRIRLRGSTPGRAEDEVLLVDDVVTTGATATEGVRVLQTAGASVVAVLVIAHA